MNLSSITHYVILSDGMGKWRKGDVVAAEVLAGAANVERLLALNAVRVASEVEARENRVELPGVERHLSYEHRLAEKDKEIARLTARVAGLEEQLAAGQHLSPVAMSHLNEANLIEEKDRAVKALEARVAAATAERDSVRGELIKANAQLAAAAQADKFAAGEPAPRTLPPAPAFMGPPRREIYATRSPDHTRRTF
jgi:hypothetical protein